MRTSSLSVLRILAFTYVSIFRGPPLLVQIILVYFGLPRLGITLDPVPAALTSLTLFSASYLSENFRSGINSVDKRTVGNMQLYEHGVLDQPPTYYPASGISYRPTAIRKSVDSADEGHVTGFNRHSHGTDARGTVTPG